LGLVEKDADHLGISRADSEDDATEVEPSLPLEFKSVTSEKIAPKIDHDVSVISYDQILSWMGNLEKNSKSQVVGLQPFPHTATGKVVQP
jgi:hypothetical protein